MSKQRIVVYVPDELYLAMTAALTPAGTDSPPYGAYSAFVSGLLDIWYSERARKLKQETPNGSDAGPSA